MNTALVKQSQTPPTKPSALRVMASKLNIEEGKLMSTLKATVFQKASDEEIAALVMVANEYDLNPFLKEIYAFPAKGGGIVPIVSVDGWNKMLVRQKGFDGIQFEFANDEQGNPLSCTATIHVKDRAHPVVITEYLEECKRNTEPWNNMPRRMLRNRTLCQASRVAFGFSGVNNEDEAQLFIDTTATVMPPAPLPAIAAPSAKKASPQDELAEVILNAGFNFTDLQKYGVQSGNIPIADSLGSFEEIPPDVAARLLKNQKGLIANLAKLAPETTETANV